MKFFIFKIIIFFLFVNYVHADNSIKFVDIDFIVNNSISGKNLNQLIDDKNKKITSELQKYRKKLEEKKRKIVSQKNILSKEDYEKKIIDLRNKANKFRKERNENINNLNNQRLQATAKMINLIKPILSEYSEKNSISIIIDKKKCHYRKNSS